MRSIVVARITAEAFAPSGDLPEAPAAPPRQDRAGRIGNLRTGGGASLVTVVPIAPLTLDFATSAD